MKPQYKITEKIIENGKKRFDLTLKTSDINLNQCFSSFFWSKKDAIKYIKDLGILVPKLNNLCKNIKNTCTKENYNAFNNIL